MAADLHALIRVKRHALEEKQKFLAELYENLDAQEQEKATLLRQRDEEVEKAKDMGVDMLTYLSPYLEGVKEKVAIIDAVISALDKRIESAREDMREVFAEVKKLEITQEKRETEEQAAQDKKQSDELDEIAIDGFRRGQED
ncbi:MAG: flagellar FliJ family protein [Alphaproteobacteria bacterium]